MKAGAEVSHRDDEVSVPRPAALILPGLDGTGLLLDDFVRALEDDYRPVIVRYPVGVMLDYDALASLVRAQAPSGPWIVIGESFSGPIALRLALEAPEGLTGAVLCASFARLELPFRRLLLKLTKIFPAQRLPVLLLAPMLLGRWKTRERINALKAALASVKSEVLSYRARVALSEDIRSSLPDCAIPLLCLQATEDRLISAAAAAAIADNCAGSRVVEIEAPHFMLQTAPLACAEAIARYFVSEKGI